MATKKSGAKQATVDTAKELFRVVLFAGVSVVVAWGTTKLTTLDPTSVWVIVGTVVLRMVDKWVHTNDKVKLNGLSPV